MGFIQKLYLTLLITVIIPSIFAAINGSCTGRNGICISTDNCSKYNGQSFTGKCPSDPNGIKCCDNIPCKADDGRTGKCVFTNQCYGEAISGKCPGGSNFKCCVEKVVGTPCSYEGLNGICQYTNNCQGFTVSGRCLGGNNIKCCLPKNTCNNGKGISGFCIPTSQCTTGNTISNKCSGSSNIKCCLSSKSTNDNVNNIGNAGKYFTIEELSKSDRATLKGLDNNPPQDIKKKLLSLIINCLDPIREIYGKPIAVTSGYRSDELNKDLKGEDDSQHTKGEAADLVPGSGGNLKDLYRAIIKFGNFDQFILEKNTWAHVSWTADRPLRRQILYYDGRVYTDVTNNYNQYL